ncbi:MAG: hypothetical protein QXQ46_11895 [Thermoplasmatales archaeon]
MRYIHHLVDSQKFRFVSDLGEIGHFEFAREGEDMSKREMTTIEKEETSPHGTCTETTVSKLENNNEKV